MTSGWRAVAGVMLGALLALVAGGVAPAASPSVPAELLSRNLSVAVKVAPPFAMKQPDGQWSGLSVELFRRTADQLGLKYHFVEVPTVQAQIDGVAAGTFDLATAAITVTAEREKLVDFSQPFYRSGLGIALPQNREPSWQPMLRSLTSFGFLQATLALILIALVIGTLIWLFERRHNEDFGGGLAKGLSSSVWWSTVAMTQASTGDFGPRTMPGRILAVIWMVGSIITIAIFTAGVTSVLTARQLEGAVRDESDLPGVRVGDLAHSSTVGYLDQHRIHHRDYASLDDGLKALDGGTIDAFVYDRPLLVWSIDQKYASTLQVLDTSFDHQDYAVALASGSALREPLNVTMLSIMESDWWKQALFRDLRE